MRPIKSRQSLFIIFVLLGSVFLGLTLFVQRNTTSISDALAAETLEQQSDVAVLLHEYDQLILALESERLSKGTVISEPVMNVVARTEHQLEQMRSTYSFERLDGASTAHAYAKPVLEDIREWLTEGIPGVEPDRQKIISIASARATERHDRLRVIAAETYEVASKLVNAQASYLTRFGTSLVFLLSAFVLLAAGIASLLTRQRDLQARLADDERQHVQRIRDFADNGADWFWEMNRELRLRWLSGRTLSAPSEPDLTASVNQRASQKEGSLPEFVHEIDHRDWPVEQLHMRADFKNYEVQWLNTDNETRMVAVSGKPLFNANGEFEGYRGIGRDITARKNMERRLQEANKGLIEAEIKGRHQAEQALRDSEMFLRTSLNALPQKLAILNFYGLIIEANTAWHDYARLVLDSDHTGSEPNDNDLIVPESGGISWHYREIFSRIVSSEDPSFKKVTDLIDAVLHGYSDSSRTEISIVKGEETEWLVITFSAFYTNGNRYCVLAMEDVTDRKLLEEEDRRLRANLAHFSRLTTVGELAAGLAHELNQPLTAISHNCDSLLSGVENNLALDDMDIEAIQDIHSEANRAGAIIKGLRKMVRKETGGVVETDINQLVTETIRLSMPDANQHKINVQLELASDLPRPVIDAVQIQQVLVNLERNAVDAIKASSPAVRKMVISTCELDSGLVRVSVQDSGGGLSAEVKKDMFSPFLTTKKDGMGMGLAISRSIVESHGGQLWVDFTDPSVTTFSFTLPVDIPHGRQ